MQYASTSAVEVFGETRAWKCASKWINCKNINPKTRFKECWAGVGVSASRYGGVPKGRIRGCEGAVNRMHNFLDQSRVNDKL